MVIPGLLKGLRLGLGLSLRQADAASGGNVCYQTIRSYEEGTSKHPSVFMLVHLAKAYGIPHERLIAAAVHDAEEGGSDGAQRNTDPKS